jgi:hypothetical protein
MTDEEILAWAKSFSYAHVDIKPDFCMHYGKTTWEKRVPELPEEQRAMLVKQIGEWGTAPAKIE